MHAHPPPQPFSATLSPATLLVAGEGAADCGGQRVWEASQRNAPHESHRTLLLRTAAQHLTSQKEKLDAPILRDARVKA